MTISSRVAVCVALIAAAALALTACAASPSPSPSPAGRSGVRGTSMIVGGLAVTPRPDPGITVAVHEGAITGPVVARTKAGAGGAFTVDLAPGRYTLVQLSVGAEPETVTVVPGEYVTVKLLIQAL